MKETAVEWLIEQLPLIQQEGLRDIWEEAKEMEKQQIIDACDYGKKYHEKFDYTSEQYYNKTFNK